MTTLVFSLWAIAAILAVRLMIGGQRNRDKQKQQDHHYEAFMRSNHGMRPPLTGAAPEEMFKESR